MAELDKRRSELETRILQEQINRPAYTKEQILVWLRRFRLMDVKDQKQKKRLIDCFVKAVYLYDDKFFLSFNYSDDEKQIILTASEVQEAVAIGQSSEMGAFGGPNADNPNIFRIGSMFGFLISLDKFLK